MLGQIQRNETNLVQVKYSPKHVNNGFLLGNQLMAFLKGEVHSIEVIRTHDHSVCTQLFGLL